MKIYHSNEEVEKDIVDGILKIDDDVTFDFNDLHIIANIICININAYDIKANNINAHDIKANNIIAYDIKANNIIVYDINAHDINAHDIITYDIKANNIIVYDIKANNIIAYDITANDINAVNISYNAYCISYTNIKCNSIKGKRNNSFHKCLDGELIIIDKHIVIIDGKEIELSNESYNELKGFIDHHRLNKCERNGELDGDGFEVGEGKGKSGI